jgi:hypothetical protein
MYLKNLHFVSNSTALPTSIAPFQVTLGIDDNNNNSNSSKHLQDFLRYLQLLILQEQVRVWMPEQNSSLVTSENDLHCLVYFFYL